MAKVNPVSLKSQAIEFLKSKGVKELDVDGVTKKLKHVKSQILVREAIKLGF